MLNVCAVWVAQESNDRLANQSVNHVYVRQIVKNKEDTHLPCIENVKLDPIFVAEADHIVLSPRATQVIEN